VDRQQNPLNMRACCLVLAALTVAAPAAAQQSFTFERTLPVAAASVLDIQTERGRIEVVDGDAGRVVVEGTVRVRINWNVPANAVDLARAVADRPPIEQIDTRIRVRPPANESTRNAVTVSYRIRVPAGTAVTAVSDSGAVAVSGVSAPVSVRTESAAIDVQRIGASVDVETGSGGVNVRDVRGTARVSTSSGAILVRGHAGALRARSGSGRLDACLEAEGDVDVQTNSSEIVLCGVNGGLAAETGSGHITVSGAPIRPWKVPTGSSRIDVSLDTSGASLEATSGSGSVDVSALTLTGTIDKRRAQGTIGKGGPLVQLSSRSGAVHVRQHAALVR